MFERFTERARRVVVLAQEEARMLDHSYIGTEHILLGLAHEGDGVAAQVLGSLGLTLETARDQVEQMIGRGSAAPSGHIPFTPRAKKVLELSLREALELKQSYIGTEHILLGLIREGHGVGARILGRRRLRWPPAAPPPPPPLPALRGAGPGPPGPGTRGAAGHRHELVAWPVQGRRRRTGHPDGPAGRSDEDDGGDGR